jgi:hypothetical protein
MFGLCFHCAPLPAGLAACNQNIVLSVYFAGRLKEACCLGRDLFHERVNLHNPDLAFFPGSIAQAPREKALALELAPEMGYD